MPCPVHTTKAGDTDGPGTQRPVEEEGIIQRFITNFSNILRRYFDSLEQALRAGAIDPAAGSLALDLRDRFDPYRESFDVVFTQGHVDGFETGKESAIRQEDLGISFDVVHGETEAQLIRNAQFAAEETELTLVGNLQDALVTAHREGMGIPQTTELLQDEVFDEYTEDYQAERAARTSIVPASNFGSFDAYRSAGAPGKRWLATGPPYDRTRESHEETDGQVKPIDEPFITGAGNEAMYPGDYSLPLYDLANCRCAIAAVWNI